VLCRSANLRAKRCGGDQLSATDNGSGKDHPGPDTAQRTDPGAWRILDIGGIERVEVLRRL
jgi:hypothetical protein